MQKEADRGQQYLKLNQPGRVPLNQIGFHHKNRDGQGVMPMHAQLLAKGICERGTSLRRYGSVRLVEVPEAARAAWLRRIRTKVAMNPLLAQRQAISLTGPLYATLTCTHFVEAHKIIAEGHRHYRDQPEQLNLDLRHDDAEGSIIQQQGVNAIVYSDRLWYDIASLIAIMREDHLDAEIEKSEGEPRRRIENGASRRQGALRRLHTI